MSSEPVLLSEAGLHGLCVSLNTPVLNIDELPVGPARASIALFDAGYASLKLAVAIRSVEARQVVVYSFQDRISGKKSPAQAMEAAVRFAEGMGFLFDEDVVSADSDGPARAMRLWLDLTEVPDVSEEVVLAEEMPRLSPAVPLEPPDEELVLEQMIEFEEAAASEAPTFGVDDEELPAEPIGLEELPITVAVDSPAAVTVDPEPVQPMIKSELEPELQPRVSLTKFRQPPVPDRPEGVVRPPGDSELAGSALGRISLVRRRSGNEPVGDKPSLLLRLLGSF
ncbi:MAG: hypothetical protein VX246_15520 [Myxococcota bacterium]|nr:hypothetical protein [Myxococcota bacterium]